MLQPTSYSEDDVVNLMVVRQLFTEEAIITVIGIPYKDLTTGEKDYLEAFEMHKSRARLFNNN